MLSDEEGEESISPVLPYSRQEAEPALLCSHPQAGSPVTHMSRANSTVLPSQGVEPALQSVAAGEGRVSSPTLMALGQLPPCYSFCTVSTDTYFPAEETTVDVLGTETFSLNIACLVVKKHSKDKIEPEKGQHRHTM